MKINKNPLFFLLACFLLASLPAQAAVFCVDDLADDFSGGTAAHCAATCDGSNDCNLRDAIAAATSGSDEIIFEVAGTYQLISDELLIQNSMTITGPGEDQFTIDANGAVITVRGITIDSPAGGAIVSISGLTVIGGRPAGGASGDGGAIRVDDGDTLNLSDCVLRDNDTSTNDRNGGALKNDSGTVTIENCLIKDNRATDGGAIESSGSLTIRDSTFEGNAAENSGVAGAIVSSGAGTTLSISGSTFTKNTAEGTAGGIYNSAALDITNSTFSGNKSGAADAGGALFNTGVGTVEISNSTFTGNSAVVGGGIAVNVGTLNIKNSILSDNSGENCRGTVTSQGNNIDSGSSCAFAAAGDLDNTDPLLDSLKDNGGPTLTHALLSDSPAIDAISGECLDTSNNAVTEDQRGIARPQNKDCDIGAFEVLVECGNGIVQAGEDCDDGNTDDNDACDSSCNTVTSENSDSGAGAEATEADAENESEDDPSSSADAAPSGGCSLIRMP